MSRLISYILSGVFLIISASSPASAGKHSEDIRIAPDSKEGAVLIRVQTIPAPYRLILTKSGRDGFGSRVYAVLVDASSGEEVYAARSLDPGRYRLDAIVQQKKWGLGFKHTVEFKIESGEITYLGSLNTRDLLIELQREAMSDGRTGLQTGSVYNAKQPNSTPAFSGRDRADLDEATNFASRVMFAKPEMVKLGELVEVQGPVD